MQHAHKNEFEQGSDQWRMERMGCLTGTRFARALGSIDTRSRLIQELAAERQALKEGRVIEFEDPDIDNLNHGRDMQHRALADYQCRFGVDDKYIHTPAIVKHKKHKWIKYSPDFIECFSEGLSEYCKLWEIKCPVAPDIHMATLYAGMPAEHKPQIQGGLWVCGLATGGFMSYHAGFPTDQQLYIQPIERDERYISMLESACLDILEHVKNGTVPKASIHSIPKLF